MNTTVKVALTLIVIGAGVSYMIYTTISTGEALEYFKHVDEVIPVYEKWQNRRMQLHGNVVAGTILKAQDKLDFRFALHRGGHWVEVFYKGIMPDAFKDCAELVIKGELTKKRIFEAKMITAKCPSKYDSKRQTGCGHSLKERVVAYRKGFKSPPKR